MATGNKKLLDPVIVISGITSTYLRDKYPVGHEQVWRVISIMFELVALHPNNIKYEAQEPCRIRPVQIFEVAYRELIEELRYILNEREYLVVPVFPFGYDWRMPLEMAEARPGSNNIRNY